MNFWLCVREGFINYKYVYTPYTAQHSMSERKKVCAPSRVYIIISWIANVEHFRVSILSLVRALYEFAILITMRGYYLLVHALSGYIIQAYYMSELV